MADRLRLSTVWPNLNVQPLDQTIENLPGESFHNITEVKMLSCLDFLDMLRHSLVSVSVSSLEMMRTTLGIGINPSLDKL